MVCWGDRRHQSVPEITETGDRDKRRERTSLSMVRSTGHFENQDTTEAYTFVTMVVMSICSVLCEVQ